MAAMRALADRAATSGCPDDWLALRSARDSVAGKARKFARGVFCGARQRLETQRARHKKEKKAAKDVAAAKTAATEASVGTGTGVAAANIKSSTAMQRVMNSTIYRKPQCAKQWQESLRL